MEKTCDYDICTGCGACSTVCPKHCISFFEGKMGHLLPKIDTSLCIDCKKCERVCPALKDNGMCYPESAHAAVALNRDEYVTSTSGGASHCLAEMIIERGGAVYGCSCKQGAEIEHIRIDKSQDLHKIKGSKYVQSKAWVIYQQLIDDVKKNKPVLFLGTPCQCAAVKSLFMKTPENLLLVDIICHGVPSNKFLKEYLASNVADLKRIDDVRFRENSEYVISAITYSSNESKEVLYKGTPLFTSLKDDGYLGPFFYGFDSRDCCHACKFAKPERCTDITIGDFWGLGSMNPPVDKSQYDSGVSVILTNTEKGRAFVEKLHGLMNMTPRPVEEAINGNDQLRHPKRVNRSIWLFRAVEPLMGIEKAYWTITVPQRLGYKLLKPILSKREK